MTAAEQVPTSPWDAFCAARDAYARTHRHGFTTDVLALKAQRAGLEAVQGDPRHPAEAEIDLSGYRMTTSLAEKDRLKAQGWTCVGASHLYLLAPPPTADGAR